MKVAVLALAMALVSVNPVRADTILIRSGSLTWVGSEKGSHFSPLVLEGSGGYSSVSTWRSGFFGPLECFLGGFCAPGDPINVGAASVGFDLPTTVQFGGRTFEGIGGLDSPYRIGVEFSGFGVVPANPAAGPIQVPFSFSGLFGTATHEFALRGGGLVALWFTSGPVSGTWYLNRAEYTLVDPIPEPATLLLVGGGLAAAALRRRRRHRRRDA